MPSALSAALDALYLALRLSLPVLAVAFVVAGVFGFLQSLTKLGEPALNAIPRALAVAVTLSLAGSWMAGQLVGFTRHLLRALPELVR